MRISTMLELMLTVLIIGGAADKALKEAGTDRRTGLFFMLCMNALSAFSVGVSDGIEVSPACLLAAAWLFGAAFKGGKTAGSFLVIPASIASALLIGSMLPEGEAVAYLIGAASLPTAALLDLKAGLGAAGAVPVLTAILIYAEKGRAAGFAELLLKEETLCAQLAGIFCACAGDLIRRSISSHARAKSLARSSDSTYR